MGRVLLSRALDVIKKKTVDTGNLKHPDYQPDRYGDRHEIDNNLHRSSGADPFSHILSYTLPRTLPGPSETKRKFPARPMDLL